MDVSSFVLTDTQVLASYRHMLSMRRLEEKIGQLYSMGLIRGFCHLYIGQEAIAAGIYNVMRPSDCVITSYREHGFALSSGDSAGSIIAELMGRSAGCSKERWFNAPIQRKKQFLRRARNRWSPGAIGTGLAFSVKYKNAEGVVSLV